MNSAMPHLLESTSCATIYERKKQKQNKKAGEKFPA